jgi:hypothetical protein
MQKSKKAIPAKKAATLIKGIDSLSELDLGTKEREIKMPTPAEYRQTRSDELLREAARQIKHLREINERLSIRTRAYDDFLSVFRNDPPSRNGSGATMGSDLVYSIERHLNHDSF